MALNSNFRTLTADNMEGVVYTRNYLKNSFENGSLTGWTELSVALTSGLPTGTPTISATAASSLTLSVTSTTPLSLDKSLLVSVPSALTAGQGFISDAFTLDRMDLGKVITVSFDYERVSGTYNFSGTLGSQTWMVYVYDATAGGANWIQPAGFLGMNQSSNAGRVACTFQSSVVAGQQYRIAVIASQAAAGASSIKFDNFTASRQTAPIGPVVTDWQSYDGSFFEGIQNRNSEMSERRAYWRRVGDHVEVQFQARRNGSASIGGSTSFYLTLPPGMVIDSVNLTETVNGIGFYSNSNTFQTTFQSAAGVGGASSSAWFISQIGSVQHVYNNTNFPPNLFFGGWFRFKIQGWSSNVQLSNDTDTRVVSMTAGRSQAAVTAGSNITGFNLFSDTHGAFNASTGIYTIPVTGDYVVSVVGVLPVTGSTTIVTFYDGAQVAPTNTGTAGTTRGGSSILLGNLLAGKQIFFRPDSSVTLTNELRISIHRLSGPSVIAASETVACRAYKSSGSHTTSGSALTVASWNSKEYDTHNAFNLTTGEFVSPIKGIFHVSGNVTFGVNATGSRVAYVAVNGTQKIISNIYLSFLDSPSMVISGTLQLNAGDIVTFKAFQNCGGGLGYDSFVGDVPGRTQFNIVKVGN